jgi:hypothetical protein
MGTIFNNSLPSDFVYSLHLIFCYNEKYGNYCCSVGIWIIVIKHYRFGKYLVDNGLITTVDVINARLLQRRNNRMIGELAKLKGWLTDDHIFRILIIQEETCEKFGEIAIKEKYLTEEQIDLLLREQSDSYMFFGEALVKTGVISDQEVKDQLREYNRSILNKTL